MDDLAFFQALGWGTAAAVLAIIALLAVRRAWKRADDAKRELEDAKIAHSEAVASGDPDRIHIAAARLRDARKRAGRA